ncbi:MAG: NHL repeat-containing protein [Gammaproteobacteria bacterium]|nr:NHL repeat-containing protein [Gammaproteobacteria bacterium]
MSLFAAEKIPTHAIRHLFDIKGTTATPLNLPTDIALTNDRIIIVDSGNHRVQVFDPDGGHRFSIGREGIDKGTFRGPTGVDTDSSGRIYVADSGNNRIQIFDAEGKFLTAFDVTRKDQLIRPIDVLVHEPQRRVYVSGNTNHRIMGFSIGGYLQVDWGGDGVEPGAFRYPATMALMPDKRLAVVDVLNSRVQLFSPAGENPFAVGEWGVLPGQLFRPKGVAVNDQGFILVSDSYMGVVQVFTDEGKFITVLGKDGKPQKFRTPAGLAMDKKQRLFVAEMRANKVSVWQVSPLNKAGAE